MWVGLLVWISFFFTLQSSKERFCWKWESLKCMGSEQIPIKVRVQLRRPARATLFRCWSLFSFILWFPLLQWMIDDNALLIFWDSCMTALRCHMLQDGGSSYELGVLPKSAKNKTRGQHWTRGSIWKSPVKHLLWLCKPRRECGIASVCHWEHFLNTSDQYTFFSWVTNLPRGSVCAAVMIRKSDSGKVSGSS